MFEWDHVESILTVTLPEGKTNVEILKQAKDELASWNNFGVSLRITGRITVPLSFFLAHRFVHLFESVSVFDPKLGKYIVVSSHGGETEFSLID